MESFQASTSQFWLGCPGNPPSVFMLRKYLYIYLVSSQFIHSQNFHSLMLLTTGWTQTIPTTYLDTCTSETCSVVNWCAYYNYKLKQCVSCLTPSQNILLVNLQIHGGDEFFADVILYNLIIYVEAPPSSGMSISNILSPVAILGHYEELFSDPEAPMWTHMTPGHVLYLRQPRDSVAEVFAQIARWTENSVSIHLNCLFYAYPW